MPNRPYFKLVIYCNPGSYETPHFYGPNSVEIPNKNQGFV